MSLRSVSHPPLALFASHLTRALPGCPPGSKWKNTPSTPLQDGFTIQRTGSTDVPLRIILHLEHQPPRFKVAPELASVIACSEDTRANILAALWAYIKVNGLQDKEDRRKVNLDARLKRVSTPFLVSIFLR